MTPSLKDSVVNAVRMDLAAGMSQRQIAAKHGISNGSVSNIKRMQFAPSKAPSESAEAAEIREQVGDELTITIPKTETDIRTLAQLIAHCEIDTTEWMVERWTANKWSMGAKDAAGNIVTRPLFQVKATLKRKRHVYDAKAELDAMKADAKRNAREPEQVFRKAAKSTGNVLEISLPDAHLGKLAWGEETGFGNYDTRIAERAYMEALEMVLERSPKVHYDKVIYVVGNDLLQSDDPEGRTTSGTQVDCDGRYHKTFRTVRNMITRSIEMLRRIAPVHVVMVSGNHDSLSVWHLGDSLECYFHKYKDVEIDNAPRARKYLPCKGGVSGIITAQRDCIRGRKCQVDKPR